MSKYCFTKEEKLAIIKFYQEESYSLNKVGKIFNVHADTIIKKQQLNMKCLTNKCITGYVNLNKMAKKHFSRRGRTKPAEERTPEDKLCLKIQQMERENERLRAENLFLKKLEEIERRRR